MHYDYANTNGKFQHISECWIADQELIQSTFSLLVCFLYFLNKHSHFFISLSFEIMCTDEMFNILNMVT